MPAEKGDPRNLTETTGVIERDPAWSPDGKWIAYFSDESGEYELHVRDSMGLEPARKIRLEDKPTFYQLPRWSPDSKKIAYVDAHLTTWYVDIEQKKPIKVDKDRFLSSASERAPVWSHDSRWLAYAKRLENYLSAIFVYSLADAKSTQLTDGLSDARYPVFDKDGKFLYFTASTDSGPSLEADIRSGSRTVSRNIYLVVLSKTEPSPFSPESDEEKPADAPRSEGSKPEGAKPDAPPEGTALAPGKPPAARVADVTIDWDKINQRILAMPLPARRYVQLQSGKAGTLLALEAPSAPPVPGPPGPGGVTVHRYDLKQRRADVVTSGVRFFEISANGEKTLTARADRWSIQTLRPMAPASGPGGGPGPGDGPPAGGAPPAAGGPAGSGPAGGGALNTDTIEVRSDPRAEWKQMYHDAWRIQREFFYDPGLHGLDLAAAIRKYEPYLESVMARRDLSYIFADMMGEITVGHLGVGGGDVPETRIVASGLLGCDYRIENGRYRFARIYDGENWNPDLRAPLTQPGVNVQEGEYLLAVNGRDLRATDNVFSFFEATSGKNVRLRVGANADGSGARDVTVVPIANEARLRNLAWIEDNRRKVDKLTDGRVAYVYMPDTAFGGLTSFTRYFYAQVGQGSRDHRRAVQRRRRAGHRHHRAAQSQDDEPGGDARRRARGAAAGRDLRTEGDDHQRARRVRRRRDAELLPPRERREVDRQADVGWPRRPRRRPAADGRWIRVRAELSGVEPDRRVGRGERRHPAGYRSRARSRARAQRRRSAAREGDRGGDGGAGEESGAEAKKTGVSDLSQEEDDELNPASGDRGDLL